MVAASPPDEVLLRRFGLVRAVGGLAYALGVGVLFAVYGTQVWPLLVGVGVLAVVTTWFFFRSGRAPRRAVAWSLVADAVVLAGAIAYFGGSGSGLVGLYAIVVVSGGILLGTGAALWFTTLAIVLALLQLLAEQLGVEPALLYREDLGERLPVMLVGIAALGSVGYLTASYAGRLHELLDQADVEAEETRRRGRRRRIFVRQASAAIGEPLRALEETAGALDHWDDLSPDERDVLRGRLRDAAAALGAEVGQLADAGQVDAPRESRPERLSLRRVVDDAIAALGDRLDGYPLDVELGELMLLGEPRVARRIVLNLLENAVEHTPRGTNITVRERRVASSTVLVVEDDGPGIPAHQLPTLFDPPEGGPAHVGLPLVRDLCEGMGAVIRHEPPRHGTGSRFLVAFRGAPTGAATSDATRPPVGAPPG